MRPRVNFCRLRYDICTINFQVFGKTNPNRTVSDPGRSPPWAVASTFWRSDGRSLRSRSCLPPLAQANTRTAPILFDEHHACAFQRSADRALIRGGERGLPLRELRPPDGVDAQGGDFGKTVMEALLGFHIGTWDYATSYITHAYAANATVVQGKQKGTDLYGWMGVAVSPMTAAFAESLGMAEPYGAIFEQPEPGSPAATAGIKQGDVLTAINGSPLMRSSDFAGIISMMAPGTSVYLNTWRDGEAMQVKLMLGSAQCRTSGQIRRWEARSGPKGPQCAGRGGQRFWGSGPVEQSNVGWRCKMLRTAVAAASAVRDPLTISASAPRWKRIAFMLLLSGVLGCLPARGHTTGLDCPEMGPGAAPNLLSDLQVKLVTSSDSVDVANEINDLINRLQIEKPNISYAELTDALIAAYCPAVANMANLTVSERWRRMRKFDTILQQQLAANMMPPGSLVIANVPLPPAVFRTLRAQAAASGQAPAQLMAAILSRAAGN
jgi:PDZ domain